MPFYRENESFWFLHPTQNIVAKAGQGQGYVNKVGLRTNTGHLSCFPIPHCFGTCITFRVKPKVLTKLTRPYKTKHCDLSDLILLCPLCTFSPCDLCQERGRRLTWDRSNQHLGRAQWAEQGLGFPLTSSTGWPHWAENKMLKMHKTYQLFYFSP